MKTIDKDQLLAAGKYITRHCDPLYSSLFNYHFFEGEQQAVLDELAHYQNADGGFGHGLEPDFCLPESSAMATTIAFQILDDIDAPESEMIHRAVDYYENTFDAQRKGWWAVPALVNTYPHAPWWHFDEEAGGTAIDQRWGNPSSEIIGTLNRWKRFLKKVDVDALIQEALDHIKRKSDSASEHEIYCYLRMYPNVPENFQIRLKTPLSEAISRLVCTKENLWQTYVPRPLDFMQSPRHPLFPEIAPYVEHNCDYLIEEMKEGVWEPVWSWGQYESAWLKARQNWIAILTIRNYCILKALGDQFPA